MARDYNEYKEYYRLKRAEQARLKAKKVHEKYLKKGWKPIPLYEDYMVSEKGEIINKYGRKLKPGRNSVNGYLHVLLTNEELGPKHTYVHQAVWAAFVGERKEGTKICHLDSNASNNCLSNLAELTDKQNINKATTRMKMQQKRCRTKEVFQRKKTYKYDIHKNLLKVYDSVSQTEMDGHSVHYVSKCCNGQQRTHHGFIFTHTPLSADYQTIPETKHKVDRKGMIEKKQEVYKYTPDGQLVKVYDSIASTVEDGHNTNFVYRCCMGMQRKHDGFVFSFSQNNTAHTETIYAATRENN